MCSAREFTQSEPETCVLTNGTWRLKAAPGREGERETDSRNWGDTGDPWLPDTRVLALRELRVTGGPEAPE